MFAWIEMVQSNPEYSNLLMMAVAGDIRGNDFIDSVSDLLDSNEDDKLNRRSNFKTAIESLGFRLVM